MSNVINRKYYETNPEQYKTVDLNKLGNLITENVEGIRIYDQEIFDFGDRKTIYDVTDFNNPLVLSNNIFSTGYTLNINSDWYLENKELVQNLIDKIILNSINDSFSIDSSCLINNHLVDCLCSNKNLENISLCRFKKSDPFILDNLYYQKFKSSNVKCVYTTGVSESLLENYDPIIGYNSSINLIDNYTYSDLVSGKKIYIKEIEPEEYKNFKYLNNSTVISLDENSDYLGIIEYLKKIGKNNLIVLEIKDKDKFNEKNLDRDFNYDNLEISWGINNVSFDLYKKAEKMLLEIVEPCKNLSPFEKYIYIYNVVKQFKKYKESDEKDDKMNARSLYEVLFNDYMVCVGFSNLFCDLLDKIGIENRKLSLSVDVSYDSVSDTTGDIIESNTPIDFVGHARSYVHIDDSKYGIDGFYQADATWDNSLSLDLYNHMVMTDKEATDARRGVFGLYIDEVFNISNLDEYYEKLNFNLERPKFITKDTSSAKKELLSDILNNIRQLDIKFYNKFIDENLSSYDLNFGLENLDINDYELNSMFEKIGYYLLDHVNKKIPMETLFAGISNVYRKAYDFSEEQIRKMIPKVIRDNKELYKYNFPLRYKIDSDENKEVYMNEKNKFDIGNIELNKIFTNLEKEEIVDNNKTV